MIWLMWLWEMTSPKSAEPIPQLEFKAYRQKNSLFLRGGSTFSSITWLSESSLIHSKSTHLNVNSHLKNIETSRIMCEQVI